LEAAVGRISTPAPLESQLESAVYESLRRPLDPAILGEPRVLTRELERRGAMFGVAGRLAAAIGVSAIIALFFVIMMPASRQPDAGSSFSATVQSFTNALGQQPAPIAEETRKPALAEFQSLLGSDTAQAAEREQPDRQSDKTLQQFMQWRQKAGDTAP
jgi:Sec-independent protein translocase protein TatA